MKTLPVTFRVPVDVWKYLAKVAADSDRTRPQVVREILTKWTKWHKGEKQ